MIRRFKLWNKWRKNCLNGPLHKFLVLVGLVYSPTFRYFQMFEEWRLETPDLYIDKYKEEYKWSFT
jgi:hypothetical protein